MGGCSVARAAGSFFCWMLGPESFRNGFSTSALAVALTNHLSATGAKMPPIRRRMAFLCHHMEKNGIKEVL
eukprot:g82712.t1